jgi:hypothetical protein
MPEVSPLSTDRDDRLDVVRCLGEGGADGVDHAAGIFEGKELFPKERNGLWFGERVPDQVGGILERGLAYGLRRIAAARGEEGYDKQKARNASHGVCEGGGAA